MDSVCERGGIVVRWVVAVILFRLELLHCGEDV